jgi:hypothetical protein
MSTAVIIGGGISGLSSAFYLQKTSSFAKVWHSLHMFTLLIHFRTVTFSDIDIVCNLHGYKLRKETIQFVVFGTCNKV